LTINTDSSVIAAKELHKITDNQALDLVNKYLGLPESWSSSLIRYRLTADGQEDWKAEVGHWINTAKKFGYLEKLRNRINRAKQNGIPEEMECDPNDQLHTILHQELAQAMAVHYFVGTGWRFESWEPSRKTGEDIDFEMRSPSGDLVSVQAKGPDLPGRRANHQVVEGESDEVVLKALRKAKNQLPRPGKNPSMIILCPNRAWAMTTRPLESELYGNTHDRNGLVFLPRYETETGAFFSSEWEHVSAVAHLQLSRSGEAFYVCHVFINPNATEQVKLSPVDFACGRVLYLDGDTFHWKGGKPEFSTIPEGTKIID
jgi:hypothetical protein